jgi:hypothetical protein
MPEVLNMNVVVKNVQSHRDGALLIDAQHWKKKQFKKDSLQ